MEKSKTLSNFLKKTRLNLKKRLLLLRDSFPMIFFCRQCLRDFLEIGFCLLETSFNLKDENLKFTTSITFPRDAISVLDNRAQSIMRRAKGENITNTEAKPGRRPTCHPPYF